MQIRLTDQDMKRVRLAQESLARSLPVPIPLGNADVVRIALHQLMEKLAQSDGELNEAYLELQREEEQYPVRRVRRRLPDAIASAGLR